MFLLPSSSLDHTVFWKMGPVTYKIYNPDKKKVKQVYNANLLKEWKEAPVQVSQAVHW